MLNRLQGRLFSYNDTHRHRLGTNFNQIPVNCPYRLISCSFFLHFFLSLFYLSIHISYFLLFLPSSSLCPCHLLQFSRSKARNYERDGPMTIDGNQGGAPNYFPNSFSGPKDNKIYLESTFKVKNVKIVHL